MLEQPAAARAAARRAAREQRRGAAAVQEARRRQQAIAFEQAQRRAEANRRAWEVVTPRWERVHTRRRKGTDGADGGAGGAALPAEEQLEARRLRNRRELQLLLMGPAEMAALSPHDWRALSCGGAACCINRQPCPLIPDYLTLPYFTLPRLTPQGCKPTSGARCATPLASRASPTARDTSSRCSRPPSQSCRYPPRTPLRRASHQSRPPPPRLPPSLPPPPPPPPSPQRLQRHPLAVCSSYLRRRRRQVGVPCPRSPWIGAGRARGTCRRS